MAEDLQERLLSIYGQFMHLKLFIDKEQGIWNMCYNFDELKNKYISAANEHNCKMATNPHEIDAGFDLFAPRDTEMLHQINHFVIGSARMVKPNNVSYNTGYYMYPRSSLSKTTMRLANSVGIIDAGYRGHIIAKFDVLTVASPLNNRAIEKYDRFVQICAPGLVPIVVEIVDTMEALGQPTQRGTGGFGSTGI